MKLSITLTSVDFDFIHWNVVFVVHNDRRPHDFVVSKIFGNVFNENIFVILF